MPCVMLVSYFGGVKSLPVADSKGVRGGRILKSKSKSGKMGKQAKNSENGVHYCEQIFTGYECSVDSFTEVDRSITDEMVELCETQHTVQMRRSFVDGSHRHYDICPALLKYFDNGVEFDHGSTSIVMMHNGDGSCVFRGETLRQLEGGKCDTSHDCIVGLVCSPNYQCSNDASSSGEDETKTSSPSNAPSRIPSVLSSSPVRNPSLSPSISQILDPSKAPSMSPSSDTPSSSLSVYPSSQQPSTVSNVGHCETDDDCNECSVCKSDKRCAPPQSGCLCDSNCPATKPKCYQPIGSTYGQCGCESDSQCNATIGETCAYSCVIADFPKLCETPESRNHDCEAINGPGYICEAGATKCTNPPRPTVTPTPRPTRSRTIFH